MKTFVTSDHHFYHDKIIRFFNRPFKNVSHMNREMIRKWNQVVGPNDRVIHLGDFCFGWRKQREHILKQLNGTIFIIRGNHDPPRRSLLKSGMLVAKGRTHILGNIIFSHKPLPHDRMGSMINIHGHIHNQPNHNNRHINACVDVTDYYPQLLEHYIQRVEEILNV